jgi:isopenicillin N synthase-like dioxygenase
VRCSMIAKARLHIPPASFGDAAADVRTALATSGCIVVKDCIDPAATTKAHAAIQRLFSLPMNEKLRYAADKTRDPLAHGFSPYGVACALDTGVPNLLKTWDISPVRANWPTALEAGWEVVIAFARRLADLTRTLLESVSITIRCARGELLQVTEPMRAGIHLIHYFPVPRDADARASRQSRHTDNTLVTLLPAPVPLSSSVAVFDHANGEWHDIAMSMSDCLLQVGELLGFITAGALRPCLHTVWTPGFDSSENVSRFAMPFFVSPPLHHVLLSPSAIPRARRTACPFAEGTRRRGRVLQSHFSLKMMVAIKTVAHRRFDSAFGLAPLCYGRRSHDL